jgi:hypothetical protein
MRRTSNRFQKNPTSFNLETPQPTFMVGCVERDTCFQAETTVNDSLKQDESSVVAQLSGLWLAKGLFTYVD